MCIYFVVDIIMFLFVLFSLEPLKRNISSSNIIVGKYQKRRNLFLKLACVMLVLTWGLRSYQVGNDTYGYAQFIMGINGYYGTINNPREDMELGFIVLMRIILYFTNNPTIVFLLQCSFIFFVIYKLYNKVNPENAVWCILFYFILNWNMMTLISVAFRQAISASIFLYGIYLLETRKQNMTCKFKSLYKKELIWPLIIILLSATIHKATLLFMPVILFSFIIRINKSVAYGLIISTLIISLFFPTLISQFFDAGMIIFSDSNNSMLNHMAYYSETLSSGNNTLTSSLLRSFIYICIIYFTDKKFIGNVYFNNLVITACLFNLLSSSLNVGRVLFVFALLSGCMYIPVITQKRIIPRLIFMTFTIMYMYRAFTAFSSWSQTSIGDTTLPYYFFWEK